MDRNGFTYIELVITVAIISILAAVIMPLSELSKKRSMEAELRQNLRVIRTAIDDYKRAWDEGKLKKTVGESGYPPDLKTLVEGVEDASSAQSGRMIRFLRRIPKDPMSTDTDVPAEETWGLRSYQSPPDDPQEGEDVFDIYSKSEEQAIDGSFYKDW